MLKSWWSIGVILFLSTLIFFYHIDKPFIGHHDWNSVWFANIARNHLRYGLITTKFGQVTNSGWGYSPGELGFHTHHPPLLPLFVAASFILFGESERSARLIPVVASLGTVFLIYLISAELFGKNVALLASLLSSATPLVIYFSKIPVHEVVILPFILFAFYQYIRWVQTRKNSHFSLLVLGVIVAQLVGWAGYYISGWIAFHGLLFLRRQRYFLRILLLIPISLGMFLLHLLHTRILTGSPIGGGLFEVFLFRFDPAKTAAIYGFTYPKFISLEMRYMVIYFTRILLLPSLAWLLVNLRNSRQFFATSFVFLLFAFGLTHLLIFRNLSFIHDYMIYYLLPFVVLSSAIFFHAVMKRLPPKIAALAMVVIVLSVAIERLPFLNALFSTGEGERARQLGLLMRAKTQPIESVFVGSGHYGEFWDVFIAYYADRRMGFGEVLPDDFLQSYRVVVRPKDHDALYVEDKLYLEKTFVRGENERFIWYDLQQRRDSPQRT